MVWYVCPLLILHQARHCVRISMVIQLKIDRGMLGNPDVKCISSASGMLKIDNE
ncbi:hypothetical protein DPMN_033594 [Dreissena polymorpha]|uniref:Uncharacterized protein n=1 Tax=Dreissena polymorpha TaxID=45954 RepID=A0A9D4M638_DREPO|nr:hypothetical protein DPMN_033594 [Dreissena polymorpha]